jgi:hypothetical protein
LACKIAFLVREIVACVHIDAEDFHDVDNWDQLAFIVDFWFFSVLSCVWGKEEDLRLPWAYLSFLLAAHLEIRAMSLFSFA